MELSREFHFPEAWGPVRAGGPGSDSLKSHATHNNGLHLWKEADSYKTEETKAGRRNGLDALLRNSGSGSAFEWQTLRGVPEMLG